MPVFTQQPKRRATRRRKDVPQQIVERYKQYIDRLVDGIPNPVLLVR